MCTNTRRPALHLTVDRCPGSHSRIAVRSLFAYFRSLDAVSATIDPRPLLFAHRASPMYFESFNNRGRLRFAQPATATSKDDERSTDDGFDPKQSDRSATTLVHYTHAQTRESKISLLASFWLSSRLPMRVKRNFLKLLDGSLPSSFLKADSRMEANYRRNDDARIAARACFLIIILPRRDLSLPRSWVLGKKKKIVSRRYRSKARIATGRSARRGIQNRLRVISL
ncbi:hypothetical protein PUN28_006218 [Cardiocondyla obscurior]|uniref:Uncharacterized protein n=1 Tax=Cardiocondyla obscurior TaxID=286306 RepID=A0AAW2G992_9HYME